MHSELELLTLDDARIAGAQRFRVSTLSHALTLPLVGAVIAACAWAGWQGGVALGRHGGLPGFMAWGIVITLLPYWLLVLRDWRKATWPDAWLAAANDEGIFIKWRSYRNVRWGRDGVQVVFIPYRLITAAHAHRRRWLTPGDYRSTRSENKSYIELQLTAFTDTADLAGKLADERNSRPDGKKQHMTWVHFPVSLEPGSVLRIEWHAWPRMQSFLDLLHRHGVAIETAQASTVDVSRRYDDAALRELARSGDKMALIRVLHRDRSMSLEEAKAKAEALIAESGRHAH